MADIQACYLEWKSREAEFITEPMDEYGERGLAGSYELRLDVPQGVDEVQLRLRLRGDYQITAYDYSAGEGEAPDLRLAK